MALSGRQLCEAGDFSLQIVIVLMRLCICQISVQRWLAELLQVSDTCLFLSTLPARQWDIQVTPSVVALPSFARVLHKAAAFLQAADEQTARKRTQLKVASEAAKSFQSDADLEKSIAAIQRSLELVSRSWSHKHHKHHKISGHFSFAGNSTACHHMQAQPAQQATAKDGHLYAQRTLIIFNLFSMEALHIAEALEVPCLAISPTLVPYTFPTSFPRQFQKAWPALHDSLHCAPEGIMLFPTCA